MSIQKEVDQSDPDFQGLFPPEPELTPASNQLILHNRYAFWCLKKQKNAQNYQEGIKKIASFQSVEQFWQIYDHLIRPNDFKTTIDYHLFKNGISPTWEDPQNKDGGKWMVRLKKGLASVYWEDLVLAIIGEQFDVGNEVCGAVVSVRAAEDIISVWNKTADNQEATDKIRDQLRRLLKLPSFISIEYKKHQDSLTDKSSFRNTVVWRPNHNHAGMAPPGNLGSQSSFNPGYNQRNQAHGQRQFSGDNGNSANSPRGATGYVSRERSGDRPAVGGAQLERETSFRERDRSDGSYNASSRSSNVGPGQGVNSGWKGRRENSGSGTSSGIREGEVDGTGSWSKYHREDAIPPTGVINALGANTFPNSGWSRARGPDQQVSNNGAPESYIGTNSGGGGFSSSGYRPRGAPGTSERGSMGHAAALSTNGNLAGTPGFDARAAAHVRRSTSGTGSGGPGTGNPSIVNPRERERNAAEEDVWVRGAKK